MDSRRDVPRCAALCWLKHHISSGQSFVAHQAFNKGNGLAIR
jgi:hypothetical protein